MMRWLILLIAFPLWAQTPDSVKTDSISVQHWDRITRIYSTRVVVRVDTVRDTLWRDPIPPPPTLKSVVLTPGTATLAPSTTRSFFAYGRMSNGDSVRVQVVWTATGGTINSAGLYTSGAMPGSYRVVATLNALADTTTVTVTKPSGSGVTRGIPFGGWGMLGSQIGGSVYNVSVYGTISPWKQLATAKANKARIVFNLATKMSWDVVNGDTVLSVAKVKAFLDTWPTKAELDPYFADSTIIGVIVSDDIEDKALNGPAAPYRAKIDSLALLWKQRYGFDKLTFVRGLPGQMIGPAQGSRSSISATNPKYTYKWLRYAWAQYHSRHGDPVAYGKLHRAQADTAGLCVTFGLNATSGGDGSSGVAGSGGVGWQMSPTEVLNDSRVLLPGSLVFAFWDYRANSVNLEPAYRQVRSWADTMPRSSCR